MAQQTTTQPLPAIVELISTHRQGALASELSDEQRELIERVLSTGKKGALIIKIEVEPNGKAGSGTPMVDTTITSDLKLPKHNVPAETLFVEGGRNLSRRDPQQPTLSGFHRDDITEE